LLIAPIDTFIFVEATQPITQAHTGSMMEMVTVFEALHVFSETSDFEIL